MIKINLLPEERRPISLGRQVYNGLRISFLLLTSPAWLPVWIPAKITKYYMSLPSARKLKKQIKEEPGDSSLICRLGDIYYNKGKKEEARTLFEIAAAVDPKNAYAYYSLYFCTDDFNEELAFMRIATRLNPGYYRDLNNLVENRLRSKIDDEDIIGNICWGIEEIGNICWGIGKATIKYDTEMDEAKEETELEKKLSEFDAKVEEFEEESADHPFEKALQTDYAAYLSKNRINARDEFIEKKLQELIDRNPGNSMLYYLRGGFFYSKDGFLSENAVKNLLIAYEDPDFNPDDWKFYPIIANKLFQTSPERAAAALIRGIKAVSRPGDQALEAVNLLDSDPEKAIEMLSNLSSSPLIGDFNIDLLKQIVYTQENLKGRKFKNPRVVYYGILAEKIQKIERLEKLPRFPAAKEELSDLGRMLLGKDYEPELEPPVKRGGNTYLLAVELNFLGLYDKAIESLNSLPEKQTEEHLLLADSYLGKWERERNTEDLRKANSEYFEALQCSPSDGSIIEKAAYTSKHLGHEDKVTELLEYFRGIFGNDSDVIYRYTGRNKYLEQMMLDASNPASIEEKIAILRRINKEAPDAVILGVTAKSQLAHAYDMFSYNVISELAEVIANESG
jgi:tetratricopeptide (TPR) repeat protein